MIRQTSICEHQSSQWKSWRIELPFRSNAITYRRYNIKPIKPGWFFVHVDNVALVYRDSILVQGITDFSDYSFLISEGFGDTTVAIGWCFTSGIDKLDPTSVILYPNPAENYLNLLFQNEAQKYVVDIVSQDGKVCIQKV